MKWVYLSPHFDDAVLSCGGLIWDQAQSGLAVEIWTICAGEIPAGVPLSPFAQSLHDRWQTGAQATAARRAEDDLAGKEVGARMRYWTLPDCIYRRLPDGSYLVNGEDDLWQQVNPQEEGVIQELKQWMDMELAPGDRLVSPMTLGSHVDHHLVRAAAEGTGCDLWYYADFPYVAQHPEALPPLLKSTWQKECSPVSEGGLEAWQNGIAHYSSQISTFWHSIAEMKAAMAEYWRIGGGSCLWHDTCK